MIWNGAMTAIVTPFSPEGESVDLESFSFLIRRQIDAGIDGIVVLGTTGESPTVEPDEAAALYETAVKMANGNTRIIAGISGNNTKKVLRDIDRVNGAGVDGIMVAAPYYNKPTQPGLFAHYAAIAEQTTLPIMVYNIPGRTGINISLDTLISLHENYPHISGTKEASGDYQQIADTVRAFRNTPFGIMAGDDSMVLPTMALGGHGLVSVLSNLCPEPVKQLVDALAQNNQEMAQKLYDQYLPLMHGLFIGGNPGGVKTLMAHEKLISASYRLPIVPPTSEEQAQILGIYEQVVLRGGANQRAGQRLFG